ncbi:hypothetical protein DL89DRAFT_266910 [Linderina pennispora]|uniref:Uncharacterized protein n=1 Tax=Linderina pennispora TaxID=61395 RepID=A0A1Y1WB64_9FUNG|nr:uncharacterized protein DL89DRAFT_266910 [Linderina pennispora]ORX70780.1 hypothetical protein DL89DRAFT_266910 [Linderina pennispora]
MPPLSETAFTLLARMTWPLVFGISVALCSPSSSKKRQITLLAKTCRILSKRAFLHDVNQMYRDQMYALSEDKDQYSRLFSIIGLSFGDSMDKRRNMERGFDIPMAVFFLLCSAIIAARAYYKHRELQDSLDSELPTTVTPLLKHTFSN